MFPVTDDLTQAGFKSLQIHFHIALTCMQTTSCLEGKKSI